MSSNDQLIIRESRRGVFTIWRVDAEVYRKYGPGLPGDGGIRALVAKGVRGIEAAVALAERAGAEYGYTIELLEEGEGS